MITVNIFHGIKNYKLLLAGLLFFASTLKAQSINDNAIMSDNFPKMLSEYNFFNDSLTINDKILNINKIRLGFDVFKPIKSSSDGDNLNYEIVGDLQITENLYLAAEYGLTDRLIEDENINFNSNGSFLRFGFDYNMFKNWVGVR